MQIRIDDLRGPEIVALLQRHVEFCRASSPPESTHVLDLDGLRAPEVSFWSVWDGPDLIGCGALKQLDPLHGEIKSMHTAAKHRGRGVGLAVLKQIVAEARSRGLSPAQPGNRLHGSVRSGPRSLFRVWLCGVPAVRQLQA